VEKTNDEDDTQAELLIAVVIDEMKHLLAPSGVPDDVTCNPEGLRS